MPNILNYQEIQINLAGDTIQLRSEDTVGYYVVRNSGVLSGNVSISDDGIVSYDGLKYTFDWQSELYLTTFAVVVFGRTLTQQECYAKGSTITAIYDEATTSWDVSVQQQPQTQDFQKVKARDLTNGGGTINLVSGVDERVQIFNGSPTLAGSWVIQPAGTPVEGDSFVIQYRATATVGAQIITIFGYQLTPLDALTGNINVESYYDGSSWSTSVTTNIATSSADFEGTETVTLVAAQPSIVLTAGENKKTQILQGTVTLINSFSITANPPVNDAGEFWIEHRGNVSLNGNAMTIFGISLTDAQALNGGIAVHGQYDSLTASWIGTLTPLQQADSGTIMLYSNTTIPSASILSSNTTPIVIIPAPSTGSAIKIIDSAISITYNTVAYATHTTLNLITDSATNPQSSFTSALAATVTTERSGAKTTITGATETQIIPNRAVLLQAQAGDPTAGDSDVVVKIWYVLC